MAQGAGRPSKSGERYPSGGLKPEIAPAALARMRTAVESGLADPKFGSQVGRLLLLRQLTPAEAATAFRIGEIYGRFESQNGLRRSTRSPSYESGVVVSASPDVHIADDELDARRRAIEEEWIGLQDELAGYSRQVRAQIEAMCVEDIAIPSQMLPYLKELLSRLAPILDPAKARRKKRKKKTAVLTVTPKHRAAPPPPAPRRLDHDRSAWLAVQAKLRPDLDQAQLNEAYGIFVAMRDRESFRDDKARKAGVNHDRS